ncbi:hypothetical protein ACXN5S_08250 [Pseudoroseicyclus sp. H15]
MRRAEVEAEVRLSLARLGQPCPDFTFPETSPGDGAAHVEGEGPLFDWVIAEPGNEMERREVDGEELLYLWLSAVTWEMATKAEALARRGAYSRAVWMEAHVRLMAMLRAEWGIRAAGHYADIIKTAPLTEQERRAAGRLGLQSFGLAEEQSPIAGLIIGGRRVM